MDDYRGIDVTEANRLDNLRRRVVNKSGLPLSEEYLLDMDLKFSTTSLSGRVVELHRGGAQVTPFILSLAPPLRGQYVYHCTVLIFSDMTADNCFWFVCLFYGTAEVCGYGKFGSVPE
jgi:hypothetical protein